MPRVLSTQELYAWFTWCREHDTLLYDLSVIAFNTGLRQADILKIQGEDIDLGRELLTVLRRDKVIYIPLNDMALAVLGRRKRTGFIFPGLKDFKKRFARGVRETGVKLTFRDFRRNSAAALLNAGADLHTVQKILGHAKITTTERYIAFVDKRKRAALQRLAAKSGGKKAKLPNDLKPSHFKDE